MRVKNALKNASSLLVNIILLTVLNFFYRTIFVEKLGVEYLGLVYLISNILLLLSLAEMGLSQAISFSLYKPLREKNNIEISALMRMFKTYYQYIALAIFFIGSIVSIYLTDLNSEGVYLENQTFIFFLMLVLVVQNYLFTHKRILIIADQKNYQIVNIINIFSVVDLISKVTILTLVPNSIGLCLALLTQVVIKAFECWSINKKITSSYPEIFNNEIPDKSPQSQKDVRKNIKAMVFHKVGDSLMNGTDNIIISKIVSLFVLGLYSNYLLIVNTSIIILQVIFNSTTSSLGNLISEDRQKSRLVCDTLNLLALFLFGLSSILIFLFCSDIISIWFGNEFRINDIDVMLIAVNFFFMGLRIPLNVIKSSAGIFDQDKYAPLFQASINIILSILLAIEFELTGVLLGTLISNLLVPLWYRPYIVYKHLFNNNTKLYFKKLLIFFVFLTFIFLLSLSIKSNFEQLNNIYQTMTKVIMVSLLYVFFFIILFYKTREVDYLKGKLSHFIKGKK